MKKQFVRDLLDITVTKGTSVELYAWVKNKRNHKFLIFFDMVDSSLETIQVVVDKSKVGEVDYEKYCDKELYKKVEMVKMKSFVIQLI